MKTAVKAAAKRKAAEAARATAREEEGEEGEEGEQLSAAFGRIIEVCGKKWADQMGEDAYEALKTAAGVVRYAALSDEKMRALKAALEQGCSAASQLPTAASRPPTVASRPPKAG